MSAGSKAKTRMLSEVSVGATARPEPVTLVRRSLPAMAKNSPVRPFPLSSANARHSVKLMRLGGDSGDATVVTAPTRSGDAQAGTCGSERVMDCDRDKSAGSGTAARSNGELPTQPGETIASANNGIRAIRDAVIAPSKLKGCPTSASCPDLQMRYLRMCFMSFLKICQD